MQIIIYSSASIILSYYTYQNGLFLISETMFHESFDYYQDYMPTFIIIIKLRMNSLQYENIVDKLQKR